MRQLWEQFCEDLTNTAAKVNRASQKLARSHEYFLLLEQLFPDESALTTSALHQRIASATHRSYLLAYRFVLRRLELEDSAQERERAAELSRLEAIFARSQGQSYEALLNAYAQALNREETSLRTKRLYLGVAQSFCARARLRTDAACRQQQLDEFLMHSPGSRASLSRFVRFGVQECGWTVSVPPKSSSVALRATAVKTKERLHAALGKCSDRPVDELGLLDVARVLAASTGLNLKQLTGQVSAQGLLTASGAIVVGPDALILPGHPVYPYAARWRELVERRERGRQR